MSDLYFRTSEGVPIYPTVADLPAFAAIGSFVSVSSPPSLYQFNGSSWDLQSTSASSVLATTLSGFATATGAITSSDSILSGFGKSQGNVNLLSANLATVSGDVSTVSANLGTVSGNLATVSSNLGTVSGNLNTVSGATVVLDTRVDNQEDQNIDLVEPTGFVDTATFLSYDAASGIITVGNGSYEIWFSGTKYAKISESLAHATGTGSKFFTYNGSVLQVSSSPFNFKTQAPVAFVYYDSTQTPKGFSIRETHGLMQYQSHIENHEVNGAYRVSGFTCSGYTVRTGNPTTDVPLSNTELDVIIAEGVHADEDLRTTVAEFLPGANHTIFYRLGSAVGWYTGVSLPFRVGTTYPQYNQNVGGVWQLTEITAPTVAQGRWFNVFVAVQQCATGSEDFEHLFIPGQSQFDSQSAALTETWDGIDKSAIPAPELIPIAQMTYRAHPTYTTTGRVRLEVFTPIFGTKSSRISVSGFSPTSHPTLTNRNANSQHASTAIGPWEWAAGNAYEATAGVEHTVTTSGMFFRAAINHSAASGFNSDWIDGDWTQLSVAIQNERANFSAVTDNWAAQAFPSVASGLGCSCTFDKTTSYLFEISLGDEGVLISCDYKASGINCLSDPSDIFSPSVATAKLSVEKSANSATVVIKNNVGTRTIGILPVRARVSAITAWA